MSPTIAAQLRNLKLNSIAPEASRAFEPPGSYLKRLHKNRQSNDSPQSQIGIALPFEGTMIDAYRAGQAWYEKFVRQPHASPQWGEPRITASGI